MITSDADPVDDAAADPADDDPMADRPEDGAPVDDGAEDEGRADEGRADEGRADEGRVADDAVAAGPPRTVPDPASAVAPDAVRSPARRRMFGRHRPDRTEAPAPKRPRTVADLVAERAAAERAARGTDAR